MQCVVRRYPALADGLHRVASPHTRHSLHRNSSRLLRPWSSADAAHAFNLHRSSCFRLLGWMVARISHCRTGKTSGRSASYHFDGGTLCWHRRGRTGETTCAASLRQLGTEDTPSSLACRHRASWTGVNPGSEISRNCCHVGIGTLWH